MKKRVLVTGGTGYIGSHTVVDLLDGGYEIVIIDNLSNSTRDVLSGIRETSGVEVEFHKLDLRDAIDLDTFFSNQRPFIGVIHFAALKAVGESVKHPLTYYQNNIGGLCNLLQCVEKYAIPNFVFSSSCTVYGNPASLPVTEKTPIGKSESPYGYSKIISEQIISDLASSNDTFRAISLRYFNPVGAHTSMRIGELPIGVPNNLMPYITQTVAGIRDTLSVYGADYNTPDGTAIRDYIHVVDLAKAHVSALRRLENNMGSEGHECINIGSGQGHSVLEVIQSFERSTKKKVPYKIVARRQGDVEAIYADASLAKKLLDWEARLDLDEMTSSAWAWQESLNK